MGRDVLWVICFEGQYIMVNRHGGVWFCDGGVWFHDGGVWFHDRGNVRQLLLAHT